MGQMEVRIRSIWTNLESSQVQFVRLHLPDRHFFTMELASSNSENVIIRYSPSNWILSRSARRW
jgi:hypothetical protein